MKFSTNQRILLSISILILFYCVTGYVTINNLVESRNKTTKNSQIIQPSIIMLRELELMVISSKNYSSSWLTFDITDHPDKRELVQIHTTSYPTLVKNIKSVASNWDNTANFRDLTQILRLCDTLLASQKQIMNALTIMSDYEDFLLRIRVENYLETVNAQAKMTIEQIHKLLARLKLQSEAEEIIILSTFSSIKTTNILLTILAILISFIVAFAVYKLLKVEAQRNKLAKEHAVSQIQKEVLAEKNKEITDSILYAKRLQQSILPSINSIKKHFARNFIFYKPKDIVSGDFYWFKEMSENEVLIAAADCTGHGVPGAFVSFVCNSGLNSAISDSGLTNPGEILHKTSEYVKASFSQYGGIDVKDGMDIALCRLVKTNGGVHLYYSGANNSICVVKNKQLIVLEATRQAIGSGDLKKKFITHDIFLESGDSVYLFTDGFMDQFGGVDNKKYKSKNFYSLLQRLSSENVDHQERLISSEYESWMGSNFQVDDVLVVGIQVD